MLSFLLKVINTKGYPLFKTTNNLELKDKELPLTQHRDGNKKIYHFPFLLVKNFYG